jgi:hypothetical protein
LGYQNSDQNFYSTNRGQDLQQMALGTQLLNGANQGYLNQGQGVYNAGTTYQQAPWGTMNSYGGLLGIGANNTGSVTGNNQGSSAAGALGGALGGAQLWKMYSSPSSSSPTPGVVSNLPDMYLR